MKIVFLLAVVVCVYGNPLDVAVNFVVPSFHEEHLSKRLIADTDIHNLPVYHTGDSKCEPVSSSCDAQYATAFRHNGTIYAYCCSEQHKPHITIHPDGIECDC